MKILAVFNNDLKIAGFIYLENGEVLVEIVDENYREKINEFVEFSKINDLFLRREVIEGNKSTIFLEPIGKEDEEYSFAFLEALKMRQFIAVQISEVTKDTLLLIDKEETDFELRRKLIAELVNLGEENAVKANEIIKEIIEIKNESK